MRMTKCTCKIKSTVKEAFDAVLLPNWTRNSVVTESSLIEQFDEFHSDWYFVTKMPFPFHSREWVTTRWVTYDPKESIMFCYSIDRSDFPVTKKRVRATLLGKSFSFLKITLFSFCNYYYTRPNKCRLYLTRNHSSS
jgi:hypothetical protein